MSLLKATAAEASWKEEVHHLGEPQIGELLKVLKYLEHLGYRKR